MASEFRMKLSSLLIAARDVMDDPAYRGHKTIDNNRRDDHVARKHMLPYIDPALRKVVEFSLDLMRELDEEQIATLADDWSQLQLAQRFAPTIIDDPGDRPPAA